MFACKHWQLRPSDSCVPLTTAYCSCVTLFLWWGRGMRKSQAAILTIGLVVTLQSNKVPVVQPSHAVHPLTPLITYSDEHFSPGSHPSHIPSEVNPKQGKCPAPSRMRARGPLFPVFPVRPPHLIGLASCQMGRCLPHAGQDAPEGVYGWLAILQKPIKMCRCFNLSQNKPPPPKETSATATKQKEGKYSTVMSQGADFQKPV